MSTEPNPWSDADRICGRIADLANEERRRGVRPAQIFAGQMQALLALLEAAPPDPPMPMRVVQVAIAECLRDMREAREISPEW